MQNQSQRIRNEQGTNRERIMQIKSHFQSYQGTNGEQIGNELGTPIKEKEKEKEKEYICAFVNNIWSMYQ